MSDGQFLALLFALCGIASFTEEQGRSSWGGWFMLMAGFFAAIEVL